MAGLFSSTLGGINLQIDKQDSLKILHLTNPLLPSFSVPLPPGYGPQRPGQLCPQGGGGQVGPVLQGPGTIVMWHS